MGEEVALARLWNRSEPEAREGFLEMALAADGGVIDI